MFEKPLLFSKYKTFFFSSSIIIVFSNLREQSDKSKNVGLFLLRDKRGDSQCNDIVNFLQ